MKKASILPRFAVISSGQWVFCRQDDGVLLATCCNRKRKCCVFVPVIGEFRGYFGLFAEAMSQGDGPRPRPERENYGAEEAVTFMSLKFETIGDFRQVLRTRCEFHRGGVSRGGCAANESGKLLMVDWPS